MSMGTRLFGYTEADMDVAAILEPPPASSGGAVEQEEYEDWIDRLEERTAAVQFMTREHVTDEGDDPLLAGLEGLRRRRNEIEQQMILLVAYMREKVRPRPYTLQQIADAAGLSVSGTRTFYDADDVHGLGERIERAKQAVAEAHARSGTMPGKPTLPVDAERTDPSEATEADGTLTRARLHPDKGDAR